MIKDEIIFILDENNFTIRPDSEWIKNKNWYCRVYLENYDFIEASFIAKAIKRFNTTLYQFIVTERGVDKLEPIELSIKYIANFYSYDSNVDIALQHSGLTDENSNFLFFKDAENEIFMLFGDEKFVKTAMPIEFDIYKKYYQNYYGYWASENIDKLLQRIWKEYPIC